jgi:hypothetical protein
MGEEMKKTLITGITVLFLTTGTAYAADPLVCGIEQGHCKSYANDQLPDTITGTWCFLEEHGEQASTKQVIYNTHILTVSGLPFKDCPPGVGIDGRGAADGAVINQERIEAEDENCAFEKIERIRTNAYLIYYRCKISEDSKDDDDVGSGPKMYEIIDGKLVITSLSEG